MKSFLASLVICGSLFSSLAVIQGCRTEQTSLKAPVLERLLLAPDLVPKNCRIKVLSQSRSPQEPKRNPWLTSDPHFVRAFTEKTFGKEVDPRSVERVLFSVYIEKRGNNEIGLFGWQFKSHQSARRAERILVERWPDSHGSMFSTFRKGEALVWLWCDPMVSGQSFGELKDEIARALK